MPQNSKRPSARNAEQNRAAFAAGDNTAAELAEKTLRYYGRRKTRPLTDWRRHLVTELLPKLSVTLPLSGELDCPAAFGRAFSAYRLEIGFGGGEHLIAEARQNPSQGFIGCEPFLNGTASLLAALAETPQDNIRIYPDDARKLLLALPAGCLTRIDLLFPDPWPKNRHAERRFIGQQNLPLLARVLKTGGILMTATDDPQLQEWTERHLRECVLFAPAEGGAIRITRPAETPPTRYEAKAIKAGRTPLWYKVLKREAGPGPNSLDSFADSKTIPNRPQTTGNV